ncbi:hypothetical protein ACFRAQ_36080 [Nocardia sp. NPDC056611]|uniref:hypothetical protein n=1 Tax=Nocardia sp. NPDC056611 TaxID=3345877 RepID=UPI00366D2FF8
MPPEPQKPWGEMSSYERLESRQLETLRKYETLRQLVNEYAEAHDSKQVDRDLRAILVTVDRITP